MNWEIKDRKAGITIWAGRDAEGRRVYAKTADRNGIAVEPTGTEVFYSLKALGAA